ncbi:recombinase family protein [Metabacillus fastidiosus]|uniref:recombinase family protein n=1 Tax=Metabacillus fastidiosus TaxID=1458 RepID=UPI002E1CB261|nr:recombinase family protein [Metabacillus fastidiosus]
MIIGYARVSTGEQNLDMQEEAIKKYAAEKGEDCIIYAEKESGGKTDRKELANAIKAAQPGNTFVVYKLDRLARSTKQLYEIADQLEKKKVDLVILGNPELNTTTPGGKLMFTMLSAFAEFERAIIQERTRAGLESARKKGRTGGRPPLKEDTKRRIVKLVKDGERATDIAKEYGIARSTVYKILNEYKGEED